MTAPVWVPTPRYRATGEDYGVPAVYDVAPEDWRTVPSAVASSLSGVLEGLAEASEKADERRWMPYREYLRTEEWTKLRRLAQRRAQYRCERCGTGGRKLNVHHLTYERRGSESLDDLVCLCRDCHREEHGITTPDHPYSEDD